MDSRTGYGMVCVCGGGGGGADDLQLCLQEQVESVWT